MYKMKNKQWFSQHYQNCRTSHHRLDEESHATHGEADVVHWNEVIIIEWFNWVRLLSTRDYGMSTEKFYSSPNCSRMKFWIFLKRLTVHKKFQTWYLLQWQWCPSRWKHVEGRPDQAEPSSRVETIPRNRHFSPQNCSWLQSQLDFQRNWVLSGQ